MLFQRMSLKLFYVVWGMILLIILKIALFNTFIFKGMSPWKLMVGTAGFISLLGWLWRRLERATPKQQTGCFILNTCLLMSIQILFGTQFLVEPTWDFGTVFQEALALKAGATQLTPYFYDWCPNNIGAAFLIQWILQIGEFFGLKNPLTCLILANGLFVNLSLGLLYLIIYRTQGRTPMVWLSFLLLFITPFYTYIPIAYTDTLAMPFPMILLVLTLRLSQEISWKRQAMLALGIGIVASLGIFVKTNILIMLVALMVFYILHWTNPQSFKQYGSLLLIMLLSVVGTQKMLIQGIQSYMPIPYEEAGFPATHYVMMGMTGRGGFNSEDFGFTVSLPNKAARTEATLQEIERRWEAYGFSGYTQFLRQKLHFTWSDGTFFAPEKLVRSPLTPNGLHDYVYGEANTGYLYLSQISYLILILGALLQTVRTWRVSPSPSDSIGAILWFGIFLFLLIWETRSRYVLCFLPVLLTTSLMGWQWGMTFLCHSFKKR